MKTTLVSCLLLSSSVVLAQTANVFLPAGGSYAVATNWSLGHVPDSNDVAVISVTNNTAATNSAGTFAAGALVMGANTRTGNLVVTGGQLSYGAASTIATNGSTANLINNGGSVIFSNALTLANSAGAATFGSVTNQAGTLRVEGNLQLGVHLAGGGGARGLLTVNGGTVTVTGNLATCNASSFSYVRLNGGVLELAGVTHAGSATERALFFNGGTLRALRDNAAFLPVAANAVQMTNAVQNGGAVIDSQGFAIAVTTPFLPAAGQTGGLTKVGGGLLDLQANSTYTGATRVAEGTLKLSGVGSLYNVGVLAGQIQVEPGAAVFLARHDALGNHASVSPVVITVPTNALVANSNTFTTLRNPVLRGGELRALGGASATYGAYQLKGTVTVAGDSTSLISAPAGGNGFSQIQLGNNAAGGQTIFDVADGAAAVDLQINPALVDGRNAAGSATVPSGLIKSGAGVMAVSSNNTFTGTASVNAGTLQLGANATVAGELVVAAGAVLDVSAKPTLTLGAGQALRGAGW
jgi:fibronectin-binding autotransporter adhesin